MDDAAKLDTKSYASVALFLTEYSTRTQVSDDGSQVKLLGCKNKVIAVIDVEPDPRYSFQAVTL
jgi:hypothetical protein